MKTLESAEIAYGKGEFDEALERLIEAYALLLAPHAPARGLPIGWRAADELCMRIGRELAGPDDDPAPAWRDVDVFIVTQVYGGGGHTAVVGDFVRSSKSVGRVVLHTGTVEREIYSDGRPTEECVRRMGITDEELRVCPELSRADTVRWLVKQVRELRPRRVFLFHHPEDAPVVAAALPELAGAWFLVHHSDRRPSSGLHLPGAGLVDLTPYTWEFSRRLLKREAFIVPLIVPDHCEGPRPAFLSGPGGKLVTACSGGAHKFGPDYFRLVGAILRETGGCHVHFGHLPKLRLAEIREHLLQLGIDASRFRYVKLVPSLARALWDEGVDLCVGSAPIGGARTAIEACSSGTALLPFLPPGKSVFGSRHLLPSAFPGWRSQEELIRMLGQIDLPWLEKNAVVARSHYERKYHPGLLREALDMLDRGESLEGASVRHPVEILDICDPEAVAGNLTGDWAFLRGELPGLFP